MRRFTLNYKYKTNSTQKENTKLLYSFGKVVFIVKLGLSLLSICIFLYSVLHVENLSYQPTVMLELEIPIAQKSPKNKIAMVIVYGGTKLPKYSKKFLDSVQNQDMDVLLVSTEFSSLLERKYKNIKQIHLPRDFYTFTAERICEAYGSCNANEQTKLRFLIQKRLQKPYLICELRPMFSYIFADYLKEYKYVGWGDMDTVWGDASVLAQYLQYDVVTVSFNDMNRIYLRGQFTIFRNTLDLAIAFTKAISMSNLIEALKGDTMLAEEGLFSKYMISTDYSILILPFQRSSWGDCRDNVVQNGNLIECDNAEDVSRNAHIPVGPTTEEIIITEANSDDCSTYWVRKKYRTCIRSIPFGFLTVKNNTIYAHPVSNEQQKSIAKFPLLYHFQLEKGNFEFKS